MGIPTRNKTLEWSRNTIRDILNNVHYIGMVSWNEQQTVKEHDPVTGKLVKKRNKYGNVEIHKGKHDGFISKEQFDEMVEQDNLLEYAQYSGNCYGTPRAAVAEHIRAGRNVILEIEVQGALQVMERCDDYVSVFLTVPSMEELENRLRGRGTEEESRVQARMAAARKELEYVDRYHYRVMNDDLDTAVQQIHDIIETEKARKNPQ